MALTSGCRFYSLSRLLPKRGRFIFFLFGCSVVLFVVRRGPVVIPTSLAQRFSNISNFSSASSSPPPSSLSPSSLTPPLLLAYKELQQCVDDYTSRGSWVGRTWKVPDHPSTCRFKTYSNKSELAATLSFVKVGFLGDSTTRSDLRAWEETFLCRRTNLDEALVFQRKNEHGKYLCQPHEQSVNLTKCGIPPVINMTDCPTGVSFRYMYKIYPWTSLDEWYLWQQPQLFRDLDVVVISLGRWFVHHSPRDFNVSENLEIFLVELKKIFSGVILYQSEYPGHLKKSIDVKFPVPCTPQARCIDCGDTDQHQCSQTDDTERPQNDLEMRSVLKRHQILYLDRWNVSKTLPLAYFQTWYCHNGTFHQWFCSHHLGFVALQHLRLIANVIQNLFITNQRRGTMMKS